MKKALYPGSFDPITNGHLDIIKRSAKMFDEVVVAVLTNTGKQPMFDVEERVKMIEEATMGCENVKVDSFSGLLVDYFRDNNFSVIVKGVRTVADFENEYNMSIINRELVSNAETIFIPSTLNNSFISSSFIKEIHKLGGNVDKFIPKTVSEYMKNK